MDRPHVNFAITLHGELPADANLPWSPYSVASALGLVAAGARGRTYDELAQALVHGGDLDQLARMLANSARLDDADAAVANTLWMRLGLEFCDGYRQAVLGWPGGALHAADFRGDPDGSRVKINADVEKTTRGLIKELLTQGMITSDTASVIVNALYLKVAWRNPFAEPATQPALFHAPSGTREVPAMRQQQRIGYAATDGWRMVTLATASDVIVADVLLPDGDTRLSPEILTALYQSSTPTKVDLALPRFRVQAEVVLNDALGRLGVVTAFTSDADFSGITSAERIWIDKIVHKAVLRVDEKGFEGAAATAAVMRTVSFDLDAPVPFHVDRPFLMVVRHPHTGAIYFLARIVEP
jgi:serpin B